MKASPARLEPLIIRIGATLPHLATKTDVAGKPGKRYLWGALAGADRRLRRGPTAIAVMH